MYARILSWLATKGESLYAVIAGRIERVTNRNVNQVLDSGNKVIKAPTSKVAGQIAKQDKIPAGQLLTPAKQRAALAALKQSQEAQVAAGKKIAEATKQSQKVAAKKAKKVADAKRAAEKKAQAAKDSKAAQESKVDTVAPSKAKRLTQKEIDAAKNLPVPSGKPQLPAVIPKKPPLPINLKNLQNKHGLTFTKGEITAIAGITTAGGMIAYIKNLVAEREKLAEREKKDTAKTTSKMKGDHPGDPKPHTYGAKAEPKKEQATNAQLRKYYDDIEKIRGGAVTGETVTFKDISGNEKTYGGASGPAWQEFSKAWEKKYEKPEELTISKLAKKAKAKVTSSKRGGGQVSRRPVKHSTMKKMYSHGGSVRKPTRI